MDFKVCVRIFEQGMCDNDNDMEREFSIANHHADLQ